MSVPPGGAAAGRVDGRCDRRGSGHGVGRGRQWPRPGRGVQQVEGRDRHAAGIEGRRARGRGRVGQVDVVARRTDGKQGQRELRDIAGRHRERRRGAGWRASGSRSGKVNV